jgi:hypothetical protein
MRNAGIFDDFMRMINNVGLMEFMQDERPQYANLTKIFVESFKFNNATFNPTVEFKIYDRACNMDLKRFCRVIGVAPSGTARKIRTEPRELVDLYRELSYDDLRKVQRGKIRNIQFPAIRYFTYYLATSVLARENTSNISSYHLAFLAHALKNNKTYNLSALIARRLAAKGPIFGGIIAARVLAHLGLPVDPADELLIPERLDLAAMKLHDFVTTNSNNGHLMYRVVFANEPELEVRLPQPSLFSVFRGPLSYSREDLDTTSVHRISIYSTTLSTDRRPSWRPLRTTPCTTVVHPRAFTRTRNPHCHTLRGRLAGSHGDDVSHLGQKPKLGGRYADSSLILLYSYHVGTLYIHVLVCFFSLFRFCFLLSFYFSQNIKRPKIFPLFLLFLNL